MNLSTAQASTKMKEVGVKKAIGADRKSLVLQFLGEAMVMVMIAFLVALCIVNVLLPQFNIITQKSLSLSLSFSEILMLTGGLLLTGLLAGTYAAFYLSGFDPIIVLKGKLETKLDGQWIRKGLVVFQFALSVIFIVGVFVINRQMAFIQSKNLGYNRDNVVSFERPDFRNDTELFFTEVNKIPGVKATASMFDNILSNQSTQSGYSWKGDETDANYLFKSPIISYDLLETLDMEILQGRSFSREFNNEREKIVINETALKMIELDDPIGKRIAYGHRGSEREIIGVVSDFHYGSIHHKIEPLIFRFSEQANNIIVKVEAGKEQETITQLETVFKSFHPDYPFAFSFLDNDYQKLYESESRIAVLSKYFSGLAIIISCLGLLGLALFTAEQRKKEIGIRKVLGASVFGIVQMLTRDFTRTVLLAIAIAIPISYASAKYWLGNFAYSVDLSWVYFVLPGLVVLLIAWMTIGYQTFKAAKVNPVQSLKNE